MIHYRDIFTNDLILSDAHPIAQVAGGFVYEVKPEDRDSFTGYFRLAETWYAKKDYMAQANLYLTALKETVSRNHPERLEAFTTQTSMWMKTVLAGFDDYHFFTGISRNPTDGMVILGRVSEFGQLSLYYFRDGLRAETADPNVDPWAGYETVTEESFTDESIG